MKSATSTHVETKQTFCLKSNFKQYSESIKATISFFTFKVVVKKEPETDTDHETDTDRNSNSTPPLPSQPTDADLQATPVGNLSESQGK